MLTITQTHLDVLNETQLASLCMAILNTNCFFTPACLSDIEKKYLSTVNQTEIELQLINDVISGSRAGEDILGQIFTRVRAADARRNQGAVYTPQELIDSILEYIPNEESPARVIDPGAGSGRFLISAAQKFPNADLIAVELDPLAALMLRANIHIQNLEKRVKLFVGDYRDLELADCKGKTLFVGNPPYLRHHNIPTNWKTWSASNFAKLNIKASNLAGLHVHFFLKTYMLSKPGDVGAFITSAEWLDVNYGTALKSLLLSYLGCISIKLFSPEVTVFPGTATTAVITYFDVGEVTKPVKFQRIENMVNFSGIPSELTIVRDSIMVNEKWSKLSFKYSESETQTIELGELFDVHRGQVTGSNDIWIAGDHSSYMPPSLLIPTVTRAKELISAGELLHSTFGLRNIVEIPANLDSLCSEERFSAEKFIRWAESMGAHTSYTARHRKSWWSVGLKNPAPILCTYMARRSPQFTVNMCGAKHINVVHGLYPKRNLTKTQITQIVSWLNKHISVKDGRTYAGGLTKFEPKEIERLRIPVEIGV